MDNTFQVALHQRHCGSFRGSCGLRSIKMQGTVIREVIMLGLEAVHLLVGYGRDGKNDERCICTKFLHTLLASHYCEVSAAQDVVPCWEERALGSLGNLRTSKFRSSPIAW